MGCARTRNIPEECWVVHPLWHEMAFVDELSPEGIEDVLLAGSEVSEPTWQGFVICVGDALWEGADAGGLYVGHGGKRRKAS